MGYQGLNMPFSPLRAGIAFLIAGLLCYISLRRSKSTRTRGTQLSGERASLGLMGLFFHRNLLIGFAIDAVLLAVALTSVWLPAV